MFYFIKQDAKSNRGSIVITPSRLGIFCSPNTKNSNNYTLRKKILRSKEMYLIDSISLYQTIRYPIQLNIF